MVTVPAHLSLMILAAVTTAEPLPVRVAGDCEVLFGDADTQEHNRERRAERLERTGTLGGIIALTHRGGWSEPLPLHLRGVELIEVIETQEQTRARLLISGFAPEICPDGLYDVAADAAIGNHIAVLAVIDPVLLIEVDGELRFLLRRDAEPPTWRLSYHWPYSIDRPSRPAPAARAQNRRRAKGRR